MDIKIGILNVPLLIGAFPHLGKVYQLGGTDTDKITLSANRYYQMLSMFIRHNIT